MNASSYPMAGLFWTIVQLVALVLWVWLLAVLFGDIVRSDDLGGWGKALWTLLLIVLPWLGAVIYLVARGGTMHERTTTPSRLRRRGPGVYAPPTAGPRVTGVDDPVRIPDPLPM